MIPYIEFTQFPIGPIPIQVWGLMVALGFLIGGAVSARMAEKRGLEKKIVWDTLGWIIIGAMVLARLFHVFFYESSFYLENPARVFALWEGGVSIMGGFLGAVIAAVWYLKSRHVDVWKYSDAMIFGLPLGLCIGRIGCFLIHDHPGTATDFFLGVKYPDGIVRHDHGLYLSLNGLLLFFVFLLLLKRKAAPGTYIIVFLVWYGIARFFLDFLRATDGAIVDTRYFSLTPAQYLSIVMIALGVWIWKYRRRFFS